MPDPTAARPAVRNAGSLPARWFDDTDQGTCQLHDTAGRGHRHARRQAGDAGASHLDDRIPVGGNPGLHHLMSAGRHQVVTWGFWVGPLALPVGKHVLTIDGRAGDFVTTVRYRITLTPTAVRAADDPRVNGTTQLAIAPGR